jgi:uncharacterized OB-fold protein
VNETAWRPAPKENAFVDARPFWEGARVGKLVLQYCRDSGKFQHYPRPVSIHTGSLNLEWREVSGRGTIYACSVVRIPGPGLEGRLPLSIAIAELDEGVRIIANILERKPEDVKIGQRVVLAWDMLDGGVPYPAFKVVG